MRTCYPLCDIWKVTTYARNNPYLSVGRLRDDKRSNQVVWEKAPQISSATTTWYETDYRFMTFLNQCHLNWLKAKTIINVTYTERCMFPNWAFVNRYIVRLHSDITVAFTYICFCEINKYEPSRIRTKWYKNLWLRFKIPHTVETSTHKGCCADVLWGVDRWTGRQVEWAK